IDNILDPFDFIFSHNMTKEERIYSLIEEICNYNSFLLQDYIDFHSNVKILHYTGQEIKSLSNFEEGVYTLTRLIKYDKRNESAVIVFKNGLLHDMENIEYDYNYIHINFDYTLSDEDYIDIMIFNKVINKDIQLTIDSA